jgi:hypothetical protein
MELPLEGITSLFPVHNVEATIAEPVSGGDSSGTTLGIL